MALKLNERYPGRFDNPSSGYPQGSFKNRTTPTAKDGSYLEKDWANDKEGFFQSLIAEAGVTPSGLPDAVGSSQYFFSLISVMQDQIGPDYLNSARINVASAATVDLTASAPDTRHINITGTTTITGFTVAAGQCYVVRFNGVMTLTNSAGLVTQSGANIVTAAGDACIIRATAANVVEVMMYTPGIPQAAGYRQTWQNVTGSRAVSTNYTNTTGRPIQLNVRLLSTVATAVTVVVGGIALSGGGVDPGLTVAGPSPVIPPGAVYSVSADGTLSNLTWMELR